MIARLSGNVKLMEIAQDRVAFLSRRPGYIQVTSAAVCFAVHENQPIAAVVS